MRQGGWTLLEILVAMVLMSMVTLVSAQALRLAVQAWERTEREGDSRQVLLALPMLMQNQLDSLVTSAVFRTAAGPAVLPFCGSETAVSFFTAYAPQGSGEQGLMYVLYRYDPGSGVLEIYQQTVTSAEVLEELVGGGKIQIGIQPVSRIEGIQAFRLYYAAEEISNPNQTEDWQSFWECEAERTSLTLEPPFGVILEFQPEGVPGWLHWVLRIPSVQRTP
jgi:hypothetical protein